MFKQILFIVLLGFSVSSAQEVVDIAFKINGTLLDADSAQIQEGMIPSAIWATGLDSATTVGLKFSTNGSTFYTIVEKGTDTTAYVVALSSTQNMIIPLEPVTVYFAKGTYSSEAAETWIQPYVTSSQNINAYIYVRFLPYTGRD